MRARTEPIDAQTLARLVDRNALDGGLLPLNPVLDHAMEALDGAGEAETSGRVAFVVRRLLELRIADPQGFDLLCLKTLSPGLSQERLRTIMNAMGRARWGNRARVCESLRDLLERFPELNGVLLMDRRGGARKGSPKAAAATSAPAPKQRRTK